MAYGYNPLDQGFGSGPPGSGYGPYGAGAPSYGYGSYGYGSGNFGAFDHGQTGQYPGPQPSDQQIEHNIYDALDHDPAIPGSANIQVAVKNRVVTLKGTVRNRHVKRSAGRDAWAAFGVHDVHNNIEIKSRAQQAQQKQPGQIQVETIQRGA